MLTLRQAAQQALKAMDKATRWMSDLDYKKLNEAIAALRAALAEPQECPNCASLEAQNTELDKRLAELERRPLDEDQMNEAYRYIWRNLPEGFEGMASDWIEVSIRYAERVHGIIEPEITGDKDAEQKG